MDILKKFLFKFNEKYLIFFFFRNMYKPINLSISAVQKRILEGRKRILLKQFEITDETLKEQLLVKHSPTSDMMKQIIYYMTKKNIDMYGNSNPQTAPVKPRVSSVKFNKTVPRIYGRVAGNRPCARDGHCALIVKNKMLVLGGNRSKIGFNDLYELDLEKVMSFLDQKF